MKRWRAMCSACSILTFIVSSLLLLTLIIWIPQAAHATSLTSPRFQDKVQATSVQTTPTVDPTVTALQKEKLMHENDWWWNFGATLISTLALLGGGIFALIRWLGDRRAERDKQQETEKLVREDREAEREKRDEEQQRWLEDRTKERFQSVVEGLGSTVQATQVGAAITLRTFLHPGYEQFYSQAFDLAVAHLRLRPLNPDEAEPLDSLSQALITIFGESFPLARNQQPQAIRQLDAAHIHLDNAYLARADLHQIWIPQTSLKRANLSEANLSEANLSEANLSGANFSGANLSEANLSRANLSGANLSGANLSGANLSEANLSKADLSEANLLQANLLQANLLQASLSGANFSGVDLGVADLSGSTLFQANLLQANLFGADLSGANLSEANLSGANLFGANLSGADLWDADLSRADLSGADLSRADLSGADLSSVISLTKTNLQGTKGLTQEKLETYKAKGAIM